MRFLSYALIVAVFQVISPEWAIAETKHKDEPTIHVEVFEGAFPTVNSFIFSDDESLIVVDVQRTSDAAEALASRVQELGKPLTHIFITHGHTDHFMGLDVFHRAFPDTPIVVHTEAIKQDIKNYAQWMASGGWLEEEPALKPKSPAAPDGFDYEKLIQVLPDDNLELKGGGVLELTSDYGPTEAEHITTIYSPTLNGLFLSDLAYHEVHLWIGEGVTLQHVAGWRAELVGLKARYWESDPVIYPGHGPVTDKTIFDAMITYIDDFNAVIAESKSKEEAVSKMTELYPGYEQADFLLKWSVDNHMNIKARP